LQALASQGLLRRHYPDLNLPDLESHVERAVRDHVERYAERKQEERRRAVRATSSESDRRVVLKSRAQAEAEESCSSESDRRRKKKKVREHAAKQEEPRQPGTWRKPRQPEQPPSNTKCSQASSSSGGNPVKFESIKEEQDEAHPDEVREIDEFTVLDSDESDASIFGLSSVLFDVEMHDELSEVSSQGSDEVAVAERERVSKWRTENILLDDLDFAYVYADFEEAYSHAGRAIAMAWSRARVLAEPDIVSDMAKFGAVEATSAKIHKVDEQRAAAATKRRKTADASSLRQPGKGTEPVVKDISKQRFIEPLAQLMMDCGVGRLGNVSARDVEILDSLRRKATRVVGAAEIPTLHRARTTADEVRIYLEGTRQHLPEDMRRGMDKVESKELEEFLLQSRARVRAANAIGWMSENLHLGWPIDKVEKPNTRKASSMGMECKQAPVAQPGMLKALTDCMVVAAEIDDPTWLALLASWLQAMANLRPGHVIRRSVPVELCQGWMLFFCKRGRQKHNRAGFYWGVPSETSCGYDWTVKFLKEYKIRRQSDVGKEMMGMIFKSDTFEYFSAKEVNALTMNVVAGVVGNPELLKTYSWRRLLPMTASHLNFSPAECCAIGDWTDAKAIGDEAPITSGYAEEKEGRSRTCKLICAAVLSSLAKKDIRTFDEVTAQQWEALAEEARAKAELVPLEVRTMWRNPDVADSGGGFKVRKSQIAFPKQLAGVPLTPSSRDGKRYCVDFQYNRCEEADACPLGLHRCAAVFRSGRTCHGKHPGSECRNTKKHANPEEENPQESPAQKRMKVEAPEDLLDAGGASLGLRPTPKRSSKVNKLGYVEDDSIMRKLLPRLRGEKDDRRGNRLNPEPPRLVAKVCETDGKGELWLGPLPTEQRLEEINETKPSIQVYCFAKSPTHVQVEPRGEWGMLIPGTRAFRCEMSNPEARLADMRALKACLVNSLRQGDNAYVHCVSGLSRAPMAAAVMGAMLMGISFEEAKGIIDQTRNVDFDKGERRMQGAWINSVLREKVTNVAVPTGFSCRVSDQNEALVHATTVIEGRTSDKELFQSIEPICRWKEGAGRRVSNRFAVGKQDFKRDCITVESIEEAHNQFGGKFCSECEDWLKASLSIQVGRLFG